MRIILSFLLFFMISNAVAEKTCSRVATINYQQVLVDAGSNKKGEGLRFYLEKDPISKKLLDKYQEKSKPSLWHAAASTTGSLLVLSSLLQTDKDSFLGNKNSMMYGGALLIGISYLTSKTKSFSNEKLLQQSINQYNKRNSPKIFFSPNTQNNSFGIGIQQGF